MFLWFITNSDHKNLRNSFLKNKFTNQSNWISWKSAQNDWIYIHGKSRKVDWNNAIFIHRSILHETSNYTQSTVTIRLLLCTSHQILHIDHHSHCFCHDHKLYSHHHTTEHGRARHHLQFGKNWCRGCHLRWPFCLIYALSRYPWSFSHIRCLLARWYFQFRVGKQH